MYLYNSSSFLIASRTLLSTSGSTRTDPDDRLLRLLRLLKLRVYFVRDKRLNLHMFATLIVFLVHWFVCAWPSSDRGGRS